MPCHPNHLNLTLLSPFSRSVVICTLFFDSKVAALAKDHTQRHGALTEGEASAHLFSSLNSLVCKKEKNIKIEGNWYDLVSTRRSTVLIHPLW